MTSLLVRMALIHALGMGFTKKEVAEALCDEGGKEDDEVGVSQTFRELVFN